MNFKNKGQVTNIRTQEVIKKIEIGNKECTIRIQDAYAGILNEEEIVLDEELINEMIHNIAKEIRRTHSKYNPIPEEITILHKKLKNQQESENERQELSERIVECKEPRFTFNQVILNETVRKQINTTISAVINRKRLCEEWGMEEHFSKNRSIILNFYGLPGTGKSMTAEAIAELLGKKVYLVNYAELESKYVGETPKNIKRAFQIASSNSAVLVFDEADSFLGKRLTSVTQSADYGVNITRSVLLIELEKFDGVVIFTTNLMSNYDEAFKRRILANICFELPDEKAREKLWRIYINDKMPMATEIKYTDLAKKYTNISGADIKDIIFYAAIHAMEIESNVIDWNIMDYAFKLIKQRYVDSINDKKFKIESTEVITEEQYFKEVDQEVCG